MTYTADVQFFVEAGLASSASGGLWDTAIWDTDVWGGGEPDWIDLTAYSLGVTTQTGRQYWTERMETGTARFVFDNRDGAFSPIAGATLPGNLNIRPGRWIRLRAQSASGGTVTPDPVPVPDQTTWTGVTGRTWTANGTGLVYQPADVPTFLDRVLWAGIIDTIDEVYPDGGSDSESVITAVDFQAYFAINNPPELTVPLPVELSSARVARLLDEVGWEWQDISTGDHQVDASTVDVNYAKEIQETARAEGGAFYFENLTAVFKSFAWLSNDERSTTIQSYPGRGFDGDPRVLDAARARWSILDIENDIQLARRQSPADIRREQGPASQTLYGQRTYSYTSLYNESNTDVDALAARRLAQLQWDFQRLLTVNLYPENPTQAGDLLNMRIGDLIRVSVPLTLPGWGYTVETHVQGITYDIAGTDWACILRVDQSLRQNPTDARAFDDGYDEGWA